MTSAKIPSQQIERWQRLATIAQEELLYWSTEVLRAEAVGLSTSSLLQATQSANALASAEHRSLRTLLRTHDLTDQDAEKIFALEDQFVHLSTQYADLSDRAARLGVQEKAAEEGEGSSRWSLAGIEGM